MNRAAMTSISPFFAVANVDRTAAFYCGQLGFEVTHREPSKDAFFAVLARDRVQLMVKSDDSVTPSPNCKMHRFMRWDAFVYTSEPDALANELTARNVVFAVPLKDTDDGLRGFEIIDPDGYVLFFGCPISEVVRSIA